MSNLIHGNNSTTYTVNINSSVNGQLDSNGDTDWYRVQFQSGYAYQIWVEGFYSGLGTLADPYVAVYSSVGSQLTSGNDISVINRDAFVTYVPATAGTYYISAEENGNNATGSYRLTVWQDQLSSIATAATIQSNTEVTNRIGWGRGGARQIQLSRIRPHGGCKTPPFRISICPRKLLTHPHSFPDSYGPSHI